MVYRCRLENDENNENNVINVTNNNVKYYENLAKQHSEESKKSAIKSENFSKEAINFTKSHLNDYENPHNVNSDQVGAYSKIETDELLEEGLSKKNPNLVAGRNITIVDNDDGTQTISSVDTVALDYNISDNKPLINNVSLVGNKSSGDLGLAGIEDIPTKVSQLQNDEGYLIEHQDISGKQDVLNAGDGIYIEDNTVSTINRADCDLSNLSETGKTVLDGQWITKIAALSTTTASGKYTIDLTDYLPDDDFDYEISVNYIFRYNGSGSGGSSFTIHSDLINCSNSADLKMIYLGICAQAVGQRSNGRLIVPCNKVLYIEISGQNASDCDIYAVAYRRMGTNI